MPLPLMKKSSKINKFLKFVMFMIYLLLSFQYVQCKLHRRSHSGSHRLCIHPPELHDPSGWKHDHNAKETDRESFNQLVQMVSKVLILVDRIDAFTLRNLSYSTRNNFHLTETVNQNSKQRILPPIHVR